MRKEKRTGNFVLAERMREFLIGGTPIRASRLKINRPRIDRGREEIFKNVITRKRSSEPAARGDSPETEAKSNKISN